MKNNLLFLNLLELFKEKLNYNIEVNKMIDQKALNTFDKVYNESYSTVLKYVVCNCSNVEDIKDIVQNVYLELLKIFQKDPFFNKGNAYIMGITKNKVNEYYRFNYKAKIISIFCKKEDFVLLDIIPDNFDLQEEFIKKEDLKFVWDFLKKKKVIVFKIFYLYYYVDLSIKDISIELNISESNVKHYLYRTLKELNSIMKNGDDEDV